jgi:glycosyltransferase involved in cell wall biosynthesis
MNIKIGVVSFLGIGQSATDCFRYDLLVRGLSRQGYRISYVEENKSNYDVIVVPLKKQPNPFPGIKQRARIVIGDIVDDMLSFPITFYNQVGKYLQIFERFSRRRYYVRLLQQCDWVVVGSAGQAESFRDYVRGVSVITDAVLDSDSRFTANYVNRKPCRLVWFGNVMSLYGLTSIQYVLDKLAQTGDYELHLITSTEIKYGLAGRWPRNGPEFMARQRIPCWFHPWSLTTCAHDLAAGDIALIPVEPGPNYNRHKPAGRVLLAMALGLPVVASAIPAYEAVIDQGRTGYIARTPDEWITFIEQLTHSPAQRQAMGLAARHFSLNNYGEQNFLQRYQATINQVVGEFTNS